MKRIIYTRADGGCNIVVPNPRGKARDETEDQYLDRLITRVVPQGSTDVAKVEKNTVPANRAFRDAWRQAGGVITTDMPIARGLHLERIRHIRNAELAKTDADYLKATDTGDAAGEATLKTRRQELRDMPQAVQGQLDAAPDGDALDAIWPAKLVRPNGA